MMNPLTVVTLGTGGEAFLTRGALRALKDGGRVVLRTGRHPLSDFLQSEGIAFETLDPLYDECGDFDTFNRAAAVRLLSMCESGPVCYAVSDPAFDNTVMTLQRLKPRGADVRVLPGVTRSMMNAAISTPLTARRRSLKPRAFPLWSSCCSVNYTAVSAQAFASSSLWNCCPRRRP